jgi:DNA-binding response OmpR family regulator
VARILCVEDESDIREDIAFELIEAGHDVNEASNGQEALDSIKNVKPDLILCDLSMPVMDGRQFLGEFREKFPRLCNTPFVFLSALSNPKDIIVGKKLGADDYILKPVDYGVLLATIESRLEQVQRIKTSHERELVRLYQTFSPGAVLETGGKSSLKKEITAITVTNSDIDFSTFQHAFKSRGHTVVSMDSGKTFLEFLPALSIDLCFLSYNTADLQGSMVLHYMREVRALDFPVVLVVPSQQNLPHIQDHVLGFDDSVIWPQEVHGFVEKMESLTWGNKAIAAPMPRQELAG